MALEYKQLADRQERQRQRSRLSHLSGPALVEELGRYHF